MAIGYVLLTSGSNDTELASYTTAAITPSANRPILAFIASLANGVPNTPALSGNGLTWTLVQTRDFVPGSQWRISVFRASGASPSAGVVTISFGGQTQLECLWVILEFNGADASIDDGVVQSASAWGELVTSLAVPLGAFGSVDNATVSAFAATFGFANHSPKTGFTEVAEVFVGNTSLQVQFKAGNDTSPSVSSGYSGNRGGVALEIRASGGQPPPPPPPPPTGARDPFLWPLDTYSPWNMPIGSGARFEPITNPGFNPSNSGFNWNAWTITVYLGKNTDPLRNVYRYYPGNIRRLAPFQIRIADGVTGSPPQPPVTACDLPPGPWGKGDCHLIVFSPDKSVYYEMFGATREADGSVRCWNLGTNDPKADGIDYGWPADPTLPQATRAYGGTALGGLLRRGELETTDGVRHALAALVSGYILSGRYTWPAVASDAGQSYPNSGNMTMGSLLAIPPSVDINSLGITDPRTLEVAKALQRFGCYIVDTGGVGDGIKFYAEQDYDVDDLPGLYLATRELKLVANNGPNSVGGGGTPLYSLAPPFTVGTVNAPAYPTNLAVTSVASNSVTLQWTNNDGANNDAATSTEVWYKRAVDSIYTQIVGLGATLSSYTVTGLTASTDYDFQVYKVNSAGRSNPAITASGSTSVRGTTTPTPSPPAAPSAAVATVLAYDRVRLTWADNSADETGFRVEVSKNGGPFALATTTAPNATSYDYTDPSPGDGNNTYVLRVAAVGSGGTSAFATSSYVTTPPRSVPSSSVIRFAPSTAHLGDWPRSVWSSDEARRLVEIEPVFSPSPFLRETVLRCRVLSNLSAAGEYALYQTVAGLDEAWLYVEFALQAGFTGPPGYLTIAQLYDTTAGKILAALRIATSGNRLEVFSEATGAAFPATLQSSMPTAEGVLVTIRVKTGASGVLQAFYNNSLIVNLSGLGMAGWLVRQMRVGGVSVPAGWTGEWYYRFLGIDVVETALYATSPVVRSGSDAWPRNPFFPS